MIRKDSWFMSEKIFRGFWRYRYLSWILSAVHQSHTSIFHGLTLHLSPESEGRIRPTLFRKSFDSGSEHFRSASGNYWQACAKGRVLHLALDLPQGRQPDWILPIQMRLFTWGSPLTWSPYSSFTTSLADVCPKGSLLGMGGQWPKSVNKGCEMPKL